MTSSVDQSYCHSVGQEVLVLHGDYSPDQLWFDFVNAVFPSRQAEAAPKAKKNPSKQPLQWRIPERGIPQLNLPFATARKVTKGLRKRLGRAGFPTFQRNAAGDLLKLEVRRDMRHVMPLASVLEWCDANLRGMYIPDGHKGFTFELEDDYVLALIDGRIFRVPPERPKKKKRAV